MSAPRIAAAHRELVADRRAPARTPHRSLVTRALEISAREVGVGGTR